MDSPRPHIKKNKSYVKNSTLLLVAFATAFFSRLLDSLGAPSVVNFIHFATVPIACVIALLNTKTKDPHQISISKQLLWGLLIFLTIGLVSALLNSAGAINLVLSFLLWTEPFMLLFALISIPMDSQSTERFFEYILYFNVLHILLAFGQYFHINHADYVQGVFYFSGSGHVVGASVALSFSLYYFVDKKRPLWIRILLLVASLVHLVVADAKQVLLTFIVAFALLALTKVLDLKKVMIYAIGLVIFILIFIWAIQNIPALGAFTTWFRPELWESEGEGTKLKFVGIRMILSYYHSPLNWWFGLGPGHTVDRLGGWMLDGYSSLLLPLGATISPIGKEVWYYAGNSWLGAVSSFFSPFWGWSAIWGDFGYLGLGAYLYLSLIVWNKLCIDDFSKVLLLTVGIHGFIFTQMQEPGYMLFIAILISLRWQEHRNQLLDRYHQTLQKT